VSGRGAASGGRRRRRNGFLGRMSPCGGGREGGREGLVVRGALSSSTYKHDRNGISTSISSLPSLPPVLPSRPSLPDQ